MTRLPNESWNVEACTGDLFPRYKVKPLCAHPDCSRFVDHVHHLVRRSFVGGDVAWVRFGNGDIVGNLVGLCYRHHEQVTVNQAAIMYEERLHQFTWVDDEGAACGALYPHPPKHGHVHEDETGEPVLIGPGSTHICPGCKRPIPREKTAGEKKEPAKRRKSWTIKVPDETEEDGALVLDTLLEECATLFGRDMSASNNRYFVVAQALALVVQNGHLLS